MIIHTEYCAESSTENRQGKQEKERKYFMNRYEFINALRAALNGKVPATTVEDNVQYYEEYIEVQLRQGRGEAEILAALGDQIGRAHV